MIASPRTLECIDDLIDARHGDVETIRELVKMRNAVGRFADAITAAAEKMDMKEPHPTPGENR